MIYIRKREIPIRGLPEKMFRAADVVGSRIARAEMSQTEGVIPLCGWKKPDRKVFVCISK